MSARGERFFAGNSGIQPLFTQGVAPFHGCYSKADQLQLFERSEQSSAGEIGVTECVAGASNERVSSSGLGLRPFTSATGVQSPLPSPLPDFYPELVERMSARLVPDPVHPGCTVFPQKPGVHPRIKYGGKLYSPHRVIAEWSVGFQAPRWLDACHSCDNPPCCNPDHLFIGTRRDNVVDALTKGFV